ncbi:hypothetical protein ICU_03549 [Bacillus cereus BAG2X1-1]|nr:hypothetical protein ICU_03549 [Bacillus cereus BAG2X1-1]
MQFYSDKVEEVGNRFFFCACIVFFLTLEYYMEKEKKELKSMSKKKREEERAWKARKENQKPHGKVKAFAELVEGTEKT